MLPQIRQRRRPPPCHKISMVSGLNMRTFPERPLSLIFTVPEGLMAASGYPQTGQAVAKSETFFPHSGHVMSAITTNLFFSHSPQPLKRGLTNRERSLRFGVPCRRRAAPPPAGENKRFQRKAQYFVNLIIYILSRGSPKICQKFLSAGQGGNTQKG